MEIRPNILAVAYETYIPSSDISFEDYCIHLQNMHDEFLMEEVLKSINARMKDRWFV